MRLIYKDWGFHFILGPLGNFLKRKNKVSKLLCKNAQRITRVKCMLPVC